MLHAIDDQGILTWHCRTPICLYHNCAIWDKEVPCPHHPQGQAGETHIAHLSDPGVIWTVNALGIATGEITLPLCTCCGERTTLAVLKDKDLTPPVITRNDQGAIIHAVMPPGHEQHGNLWIKDADMVHTPQPHPTLAHLKLDEIRSMQEQMRAKAPNAPVEWMLTVAVREEIHRVYLHPAVERHRELARQLIASGKTPPTGGGTP